MYCIAQPAHFHSKSYLVNAYIDKYAICQTSACTECLSNLTSIRCGSVPDCGYKGLVVSGPDGSVCIVRLF